MRGCIVSIDPGSPYRKPRLPFSANASRLHHLLQAWKGVRLCLDVACTELPSKVQEEYRVVRPIYDLETAKFDLDFCELGKSWLGQGAPHPLLVVGFFLQSWDHGWHACSFDLSLLKINDPEFTIYPLPPGLDRAFLKTASIAAIGVNNCVSELFDLGYILCPAEFFDCRAFLQPREQPILL